MRATRPRNVSPGYATRVIDTGSPTWMSRIEDSGTLEVIQTRLRSAMVMSGDDVSLRYSPGATLISSTRPPMGARTCTRGRASSGLRPSNSRRRCAWTAAARAASSAARAWATSFSAATTSFWATARCSYSSSVRGVVRLGLRQRRRGLPFARPRLTQGGLGRVGVRAFERENRLPPLDGVTELHLDGDDAARHGQEEARRSVGIDPHPPRGHDFFDGDLARRHRLDADLLELRGVGGQGDQRAGGGGERALRRRARGGPEPPVAGRPRSLGARRRVSTGAEAADRR